MKSTMLTNLSEDHATTYQSMCKRISDLAQEQARHYACSQGLGKVNVTDKHHGVGDGTETLSELVGQAEKGAERLVTQPPVHTDHVDSRFRSCGMLEDTKVHTRHRSVSRTACGQGSIDDTEGNLSCPAKSQKSTGLCHGTATALDMKSMVRDYGHEVKVALETDSVLGSGMSLGLGAGQVRHVDAQLVCVLGVSHKREATIRKNPGASDEADLMTMFLDGNELPLQEGQIAMNSPCSATWLESGWTRTGRERSRRETRQHSSINHRRVKDPERAERVTVNLEGIEITDDMAE